MLTERFFNNAGPVVAADHYCLPPLERFDLIEIEHFIAQKRYFILHAPRQTGKTTTLLALAEHLRPVYRSLYVNIEIAQSAREDVYAAMQAIVGAIAAQARLQWHDGRLQALAMQSLHEQGAHGALTDFLAQSVQLDPQRPMVLLLDEVDALIGDTLISLLRQIRAGYGQRPAAFPQTVILCGVRDVRDYRMYSENKEVITGGSAFNIKAESLRMGNFNETESRALLLQHTQETGQIFTETALQKFWELTQGQPWLLNALAYQVTFRMKENRDRSRVIDVEAVDEAKESLILRRDTHLDQLADKLQEPRVKRVIMPILQSEGDPDKLVADDLQYVRDLGLVTPNGMVRIANPIYQEIIPRELNSSTTDFIMQETAWYIQPDGRLDMPKLLSAFQEFFREHSEHWIERFDYKEAGPQLLLQAFLQRIVNGGGRIEREYGLGRLRTDLLIVWFYGEHFDKLSDRKTQKIVLELKVLRNSLEKTIEQGLAQTWEYVDRCAGEEAHLLIFDRSDNAWEEKIFYCERSYKNIRIELWGM